MIDSTSSNILILVSCVLGLLYALAHAIWLSSKKFRGTGSLEMEKKVEEVFEVGSYIEKGAKAFLFAEYKYIGVFVLIMAVIIFFAVEEKIGYLWATVAFLAGAITSLISGYIGMRVAVFSNYRCSLSARNSMTAAFRVAYSAGCVMGFTLTSLGLLVLQVLIVVYSNWYLSSFEDIPLMYENLAAYGLGGSTMALFGRVGGGIYTKAADVGADLVGKVEEDLAEDSPSNPATIADNVGDNVGDVAGMGSDLFGSFAESTCAALVVASTSPSFYFHPSALYYPLVITALGILACLVTSLLVFVMQSESYDRVQLSLKLQLLVSTVIMIPLLYLASEITLPEKLTKLGNVERKPYHAFLCTLFGLASGLIIGFVTEYYTSHSYGPVRQIATASEAGPSTNLIYGLALGQYSITVPVICLAVTCFVAHFLLGMFGVALAALGILSTMSIGLAIDSYGPVSDNAGGIAEMCELGETVREKTDSLDAAGNTTAAIGKGFAIGSAALVSLSLNGAFLTRTSIATNNHPLDNVNFFSPLVFAGFIIGIMLPFLFTSMTMKSVGKAALDMVKEIRLQLRENPKIRTGEAKPNYERCIAISTAASLKEMIAPGALVILTPFALGVFIGPIIISGLLPGALVTGVCLAISSSNAGGAWDNAKKFIESGSYRSKDGFVRKKGSVEHKSAVIGDTVGDPLKDTSGPSLNILIKLMAIFSLVFSGFFDKTALLQCTLDSHSGGCSIAK